MTVKVNVRADSLVGRVPHKDCPRCGRTKPLSLFGLRVMRRRDGTIEIREQGRCRRCRALVRPEGTIQ